jgi:hypothetical protein
MIIFVDQSDSRTADYTDSLGGHTRTWAVTVFVPDRKEFFNLGDFTGTPPPFRKEYGSTVYGSQPTEEVADALLALDQENR